jgi:hypothetical protein
VIRQRYRKFKRELFREQNLITPKMRAAQITGLTGPRVVSTGHDMFKLST